MARMLRTQIYLESELSAALDRIARRRGVSRATILRLAARRFLDQEESAEEDAIFAFVGIAGSGLRMGSEEHDRILAEAAIDESG
ncbi:MAG: CopG family transcriptional regulator [Chloroflexota bacterium]